MDDIHVLWGIIIALFFIAAVLTAALLRLSKRKKLPFTGGRDQENDPEEELIDLVREGKEQGTIDDREAEMIHNVLDFDDKEAKDIMTHRSKIVFLDGETSFVDTLPLLVKNGRSRYPVFLEDTDNIIGVLHIKDVLSVFQKNERYRTPISEIEGLIRKVDFIPETTGIHDLLLTMQSRKNHIAMVVDEYGQVSGLVAMEDILEEIVGNIEDEHDHEKKSFRQISENSLICDGMTSFQELADRLGISADDLDFETLNGFLIDRLERIPEESERPVVEADGYRFTILSVKDQAICQVKIEKLPENRSNGSGKA